MKTITKGKHLLLIVLLIALLAWPVYRLCLPIANEIAYRFKVPTQAEQTVYAYAKANGLRYGDYPKDLIALLERNPETETFVLEYPLKKDQHADIHLSQAGNGRNSIAIGKVAPPLIPLQEQRNATVAGLGEMDVRLLIFLQRIL